MKNEKIGQVNCRTDIAEHDQSKLVLDFYSEGANELTEVTLTDSILKNKSKSKQSISDAQCCN